MADSHSQSGVNWWLFLFSSVYLVVTAHCKAALPGPGEWPPLTLVHMTMGLRLAMVTGLFGLRTQLRAGLPPQDRRRGAARLSPCFGLDLLPGDSCFSSALPTMARGTPAICASSA